MKKLTPFHVDCSAAEWRHLQLIYQNANNYCAIYP